MKAGNRTSCIITIIIIIIIIIIFIDKRMDYWLMNEQKNKLIN